MKSKILVIDDNCSVKTVFGDYLTKNGYEVIEVEIGRKGLEEIQKNVLNLVTVDLVIPEMDEHVFGYY